MFKQKLLQLALAIFLLPAFVVAQNTTSTISGTVKTNTGEPLTGATIIATHEPTGAQYKVQSRSGGFFNISNMNPGGPYNIQVSFVNFQTDKRSDIYLGLGETYKIDFALVTKADDLGEVTVKATTKKTTDFSSKGGAETFITKEKMENLPTVGRNLQDYLRFVPQAKIAGADGNLAGVSFGGQNNRYNSFYVDGAANNDQFGLAGSGTNGGQTGSSPISIDAIDQIQVILSPYDASIGNFTGAGINATTRSGTNKFQASLYTFYRNQDLTGKTPTGDKSAATKLADFSSKTYGFRVGGPIVKNKAFFFLNIDMVRDERPQPWTGTYAGNTSLASADFTNLLNKISSYGYDPGGFMNNVEEVKSDRLAAKIDWNINTQHKLTLSYRYAKADRFNVPTTSNTSINFYNGGYLMPNKTHSGSAELRSLFKKGQTNRLLLTFTRVVDDRNPLGNPFPRVTVNDGSGRFVFGTENFSAANLLEQSNFAFLDYFKFTKGKHNITIGTDNEYTKARNVFVRDNFGTYTFQDVASFINNGHPSVYSRSFSLLDNVTGDATKAAAKFSFARLSGFINDEITVGDNLTLNIGVRIDYTRFLQNPTHDDYFTYVAMPKIAAYYDLQGARSGKISQPKASISPRFGFTYKMPDEGVVIRGGAGLFAGRIPLVWPGGVFNNTGRSVGGFGLNSVAATTAANLYFNPDPYNQPTAQSLGIDISNTKGQVDLIAKDFKLPKVFRASLAFDKRFDNGWSLTAEAIITKNINEIYYQNVNILPPTLKVTGPDNRNTYSATGSAPFIPMNANGTNPYTGIYLLSNNQGKTGFAHNFTLSVNKNFKNGVVFNASYAYGHSQVTYEGTSSQNNSQYNTLATVNGRNFAERQRSNFDLGHRITAFLSKKFTYANKSMATTISLFYTGQSGNPLTYVYNASIVRDVNTGNQQDLIYIPTSADIQSSVFVTASGLTPAQQKAALEDYIANDKYLSKRRGQYAERNGGRLPFTNVLDLNIKQDFNLKIGKNTYQLQVSYDIFNFSNMLNRDWGRTYFASFDTYSLIQFRGFQTGTTVPTYSFVPPASGNPYTVSTSTAPTFSARWVSQLGVRLSF
ncbi:MAG: TonB-dependent receptor [Chitinophagaceae bacterium]|nr:TonB-dependent receptor [Chitinophagaceae bacterium]MCW5905442.1 TonB-dependent receptor [Chitinophagaceae bacterium]